MKSYLVALGAALIIALALPALAATTGIVKGTTTLDGQPVRGVTLTLKGEGTTLQTQTAEGGAFAFNAVPFGHYTLSAHRAGIPDVTQELDLESDAVVTLAIELRPLREIGRTQITATRGASGQPVAVNSVTRTQIAALPNNQSLNSIIQTVPGVVHFSYNEPVAHGFHGLSYEIDGVPLPLGTTSNFSEVVDPRSVDSLEVFTGAFPAEFGGSRQGAVVNILSHRASDIEGSEQGQFTLGAGGYGEAQSSLADALKLGTTRLFLNLNVERSNRGIDSPTFVPNHDRNNQSNQFLRSITALSSRDTLALDFSNNFAGFQIPINTVAGPNDPVVVPASTDDVQLEFDRFLNLSFTHNTADGLGYFQVVPWYRYDRVAYLGDLPNDLMGFVVDPNGGPPTPLDGLRQDRRSQFAGLRLAQFRSYGPHALKIGLDGSVENFSGTEQIAYYDQNGNVQNFFDNANKRGSQIGAYIQDKWSPTKFFSVFGGLRFDRSNGYTSGSQLSPRLEINGQLTPRDLLHAYYGRMYAAPFLEDTRRAAVVTSGGNPNALPVYDLQPERDRYYEFGLAHTFAPGQRLYVNLWKRDATDVLDTTQLFPTPIFAVFNNAIGTAKGVDARLDLRFKNGDSTFVSATVSKSQAGGISGSTFLFCPPPVTPACGGPIDLTLQPEDHDQTVSATLDYTKRFGGDHAFFASVEPQYGTGYPVQFQSGAGRLPPHLTFDLSLGRDAKRGSLGFVASWQNVTNRVYLLKVNNGFNTTQYGPGSQFTFRLTAPI